jgi:hypothetical protein
MLDAALAYAARGIAVFPLRPHSKVPLLSRAAGGHGVLDASTDQARVRRWWGNRPDANIGIATGLPSGFFVLDIDPRHGGEETLGELEGQHGLLPETVISYTGGGGEHRLWRHLERVRNSAGNCLGAGLDVRATGGYIVAPPSIHENGRAYCWDVDRGLDDMAPADAPGWLVALVGGAARTNTELPENWRRLVRDGVSEGGRNTAIARLTGHLLRRGIDPFVALDLVKAWNITRCHPPLGEDEIVQTVDSIAGRERQRRETRNAR